MTRIIALFSLTLLISFASAKPAKVIFDTDMGNDVDDALALVMLHAYEKAGKLSLGACSVNKANVYAPVYVSVVNEFYGRGDIPIFFLGTEGPTKKDGLFNKQVSEKTDKFGAYQYPRRVDTKSELVPAVKGLRKFLADSEDGGVVYISVGFSTNVSNLLKSEPDEISPLSGSELVAKKVSYFSVMAGDFSGVEKPEYNVVKDIPAFKYFVENCPVPIVFSGFEVGKAICFPHDSVDTDMYRVKGGNPVADAYNLYAARAGKNTNGRHDRPSWDMTSVLVVAEPSSFDLSEPGVVSVDEKGRTSFTQKASGKHRYILVPNERDIKNIIERMEDLCSYNPTQK